MPKSFYQSYWLMSSPLHEDFTFFVAVYHYWRKIQIYFTLIEPRLGTGRYFMAMGNSMNMDRASKALSGIADDLG